VNDLQPDTLSSTDSCTCTYVCLLLQSHRCTERKGSVVVVVCACRLNYFFLCLSVSGRK